MFLLLQVTVSVNALSGERLKGKMTFIFYISLSLSLYQESKKHLAGLGSLGLGSLITEITASEEETAEQEQDQSNTDAEGLFLTICLRNVTPSSQKCAFRGEL